MLLPVVHGLSAYRNEGTSSKGWSREIWRRRVHVKRRIRTGDRMVHRPCVRVRVIASMSIVGTVSVLTLGAASTSLGQPWEDPRFDVDVRFPPPDPSAVLMSAAVTGPPPNDWRFTFSQPDASWFGVDFDDSSWATGSAAFGQYCCAEPLDSIATTWPTQRIWLRREFFLSDLSVDTVLWGRWDDTITVYINGVVAFTQDHWSPTYRYAAISDEARDTLGIGENTIAVVVRDFGGASYFDLGLMLNPMADAPSTGYGINPALNVFHEMAAAFFERNIVPAASVAVMKGERIVLNYGYGYMEKERITPVPPDAVFRLASLDKTPGAAAARRLIDDGFVDPVTGVVLTLNTPVFGLLEARGLDPLPGYTPDPEIGLVTVGHLIGHRSGLRELSWAGDMLQVTGTPLDEYSSIDNVRYVYSHPLEFTPGTEYRYCSACMMVLRHLVDGLTGGFESYFADVVMDGYGEEGMTIAHEPLDLRDPLEPWYRTMEMPYERDIYLDHYYALVGSAEAYARMCRGYNLGSGHRLINPNTGDWAPVQDNGATWFGGGMAGTRTFAIQRRWDEVTIVIVSNSDADVGPLAVAMNDIVDTLPPSAWTYVGDIDVDGDVDIDDFETLFNCTAGPGETTPPAGCTPADYDACDFDNDQDVDSIDFATLQHMFTGPGE
jgi:CubicO group peptidase (beta-lactamase class C family)